jgi:hypothetical protein
MRRHQAHLLDRLHLNRLYRNRRSVGQRPLVLTCLVIVAAFCFLILFVLGGDAGSISAQISPLSPLGAPAITDGAPLSLTQLPLINVMASGQAGLTRLALLLFGIIVGVGIVIWRKP